MVADVCAPAFLTRPLVSIVVAGQRARAGCRPSRSSPTAPNTLTLRAELRQVDGRPGSRAGRGRLDLGQPRAALPGRDHLDGTAEHVHDVRPDDGDARRHGRFRLAVSVASLVPPFAVPAPPRFGGHFVELGLRQDPRLAVTARQPEHPGQPLQQQRSIVSLDQRAAVADSAVVLQDRGRPASQRLDCCLRQAGRPEPGVRRPPGPGRQGWRSRSGSPAVRRSSPTARSPRPSACARRRPRSSPHRRPGASAVRWTASRAPRLPRPSA